MAITVSIAVRRTLRAVCLTCVVLTVMPMTVARARNPIFTFSAMIATLMLLFRIWKVAVADTQITAFHLMVNAVNLVKKFRHEFITYDPTLPPNSRRQRNRKIMRLAMLFVMAQKSIIPTQSFSWLHSLVAYKFLIDVFIYLRNKLVQRQRERRQQSQEAGVAHQAAETGDNDNVINEERTEAETQRGRAVHTSENSQSRVQRLPASWLLSIRVFKALLCCSVLYHQTFNGSLYYVLSTLTYFLLNQGTLHTPLTLTLESFQFDYFEGLEQYYVTGFLGVLEISFSLAFMTVCLLQSEQLLMLVALYTNVYTCARELINNSVNSAFAEWTVLAHFAKATKKELQELDDVCAICLADMWSARKTPCQHFFHGRCLRKCLQQRSACPMCFKKFEFY